MKTLGSGAIFILSMAALEVPYVNALSTYVDVQDNVAMRESSSTRDFEVKSEFACVALCARYSECCASSFIPESICRLEMSADCMFFSIMFHRAIIARNKDIPRKTYII